MVVEIAGSFVPADALTYERNSAERSHFSVRASGDDELPTVKFQTAGIGMLAELRGDLAMSMIPPSVHESGEIVRWVNDNGVPPVYDYRDLKDRMARVVSDRAAGQTMA